MNPFTCFSYKLSIILLLPPLAYGKALPEGIVLETIISPCVLYCITIDPQKRSIILETTTHGDRENTSCIAMRKKALGGINANNYRRGGAFNGNAVDFLKIHKLYTDPGIRRSALAWNKGDARPLIGRLEVEHTLTIGKQTFAIDAVNQPCDANKAILYTRTFGTGTKDLQIGHECVIEKNRVRSVLTNQANTVIPKNGYIYSIGTNRAIDTTLLKKGLIASYKRKVFLKNKQGTFDITDKDYIVSGAGLLIQDGIIVDNFEADFMHDSPITHCQDEIAADFSIPREREWLINQQHPRTAVGILPDGKWLFVIADGRQPGYSMGVNFQELAHFMLKKGCIYALNMGGGGCSTLFLEDAIINSPCGTKEHGKSISQEEKRARERPVCSAFLIR